MISMCLSVLLHAQQTSCESLIEYVEENGSKKGSVGAMQLLQSTWLINVDAYTINNTLVVIAEKKMTHTDSAPNNISFVVFRNQIGNIFQGFIVSHQRTANAFRNTSSNINATVIDKC